MLTRNTPSGPTRVGATDGPGAGDGDGAERGQAATWRYWTHSARVNPRVTRARAIRTSSPTVSAYTRRVPSALTVATRPPSRLKARPVSRSVWPGRICRSRPDLTLQILVTPSSAPVASSRPSGLKATAPVTPAPLRTSIRLPEGMLQTAAPSAPEEASMDPSGLNARLRPSPLDACTWKRSCPDRSHTSRPANPRSPAKSSPSGLNATSLIGSWGDGSPNVRTSLLERASHTWAVPSSVPAATRDPSAAYATLVYIQPGRWSVRTTSPEDAST